MEGLVLIAILIGLLIVGGSISGLVALSKIGSLRKEVLQLRERLSNQTTLLAKLIADKQDSVSRAPASPEQKSSHVDTEVPDISVPPAKQLDESDNLVHVTSDESTRSESTSKAEPPLESQPLAASQSGRDSLISQSKPSDTNKKNSPQGFDLETFLSGNGLLWIGGIVLSLGGIFLAKYSIDAGLFPPELRIILGALFGISLVVLADYLYRHPKRFNINTPMLSAALASGGVITSYAMAYIAFDVFAFIGPSTSFVIMAIIALVTAWLSIRLGPILAAIGIIGAYLVPALVSTGSNNVLLLLIYVSVVSFSSVWVHQVVNKLWIWGMAVLGHFLWFAIAIALSLDLPSGTLASANTVSFPNMSILAAFSLVSIYLFTLFPVLNWNLRERFDHALSLKQMLMPRQEQLGVILAVLFFSVYTFLSLINSPNEAFDYRILYAYSCFWLVLLLAPTRHSAFDSWPFIGLALVIFVFLLMPTNYDYSDNLFVFSSGYLFIQSAVFIGLAYAMFMHLYYPKRPAYLLLLATTPLLLIGLAYALSVPQASHYLYPIFAFELGIIGLLFGSLATKVAHSYHKMTYLLIANGCLALILTMTLSASTLSLALAAQIALMASLSARFNLPLPSWLYKGAMLAVVARLSLAPWLEAYSQEFIWGIHWTIVIYPMALALLYVAYRQLSDSDLKAWFGAALIHLLAVLITTESSYLLNGGYPNIDELDFKQSALLGMNYLVYAAFLMWRKQFTRHPTFYHFYIAVLLVGVFVMQVLASVVNNPYFSQQAIGEYPVINWLVILWLIPCLCILGVDKMKLLPENLKTGARILAGIWGVLYFNSIIRMSFADNIDFAHNPITQAELYCYSIVYLLLSVLSIVWAQRSQSRLLLHIGFGILALVVLKAFLIDMKNLEGLYRALSFLGLGLSIVGIAWLFQRLNGPTKAETTLA